MSIDLGTDFDLGWQAEVRSKSFSVVIPEVIVRHADDAHQRWKSSFEAWMDSGRLDPTHLAEYGALVSPKRIISFWADMPSFGWAEAHITLLLEAQGYQCWTGVQLFTRDGRAVISEERKRNTEAVEALLRQSGLALPRETAPLLDFRPKNPDLVCFHPARKEWRFCEAKRDESVHRDQLKTLGVLHCLTGAPVAVVRLVSQGRRPKARVHTATFTIERPLRVKAVGQPVL
jgi:hypothetical protein